MRIPMPPSTWSPLRYFFDTKSEGAPDVWIDYWVICDAATCYLFCSGDDGRFYRSQTSIQDSPAGMSDLVIVVEDSQHDLFEGSSTYKLKGEDRYLTLVEALEAARTEPDTSDRGVPRAWMASGHRSQTHGSSLSPDRTTFSLRPAWAPGLGTSAAVNYSVMGTTKR
jgi:hypothetical protein